MSPNSLISRFFRLIFANVLSNLMVPLATIFSTAFLGHLAEIHHLAGVALAGNLFSFLYMLLASLRMSTTALTAQAVGQEDRTAMILVGVRNTIVALGCGLVLILLQYPIQQLGLAWLDAPSEVVAAAISYLQAAMWGAPAILINYVLLGWFLGREKNGAVLLLSIISSVANIGLDYLFIIDWDLASLGAGASVAISQYLVLFIGLVLVFREVKLTEIRSLFKQIWERSPLLEIFSLNGNLLINNLLFILALVIFNYVGVSFGTTLYTENALLLEIVFFNSFLAEGIGFGVETLSGNCKGQGTSSQLPALIGIAVATSLVISLIIGGLVLMFPEVLFSLFTSHTELTAQIGTYTVWLLPILGCTSVAFILECYFLGITAGNIVQNVSLFAFSFGFAPAALVAWKLSSNNLLWFSFCLFLLARIVGFGVLFPRTLREDIDNTNSLTERSEISSQL
jgi:multidrug resistance protein, MATE family